MLLGASLFKISLALLGLFILIATRLPIWTPQTQTGKPLVPAIPKSHLLILAAILLFATALRLYGLDGGLWFDEIVTYVNYVQVPFGEAISTYDNQNQHILYSLLANLAFYIFGESVWSLRLPAVLFGTGSIWALYLLGREVGNSGKRCFRGLYWHFRIIMFGLAKTLADIPVCSFLRSWQAGCFCERFREGTPRLWLLYAVAVALGAYTLIYMVFVVFGHFAIYLITLYSRRGQETWPSGFGRIISRFLF